MVQNIKMEEIVHQDNLPAKIILQTLAGDTSRVPPHWHKDIELNLVQAGTSISIVDGRQSILSPNDINIINSKKIHYGDILEDSGFIKLITIQWDYDFFLRYCPDFPQHQFSLDNREWIKPKLRELILKIADLHQSKIPYSEMKIHALLLEIGSLLLEHCLETNSYYQDYDLARKIEQIQESIIYIEKNYSRQISLAEIAHHVNMSPAYFSRKFKQFTGINFYECLTLHRVQKARDELLNTDQTITEIAFNNGFPNVKSFIESFKKIYHITPKQYQKAHKC